MSISQYAVGGSGSLIPYGGIHQVMETGEWRQPIQSLSMPGIIGTAQLLDYRKERSLSCEFRIQGYSDFESLMTDLDYIDSLNQTLTGTVVLDGTLIYEYQNCTFTGFAHGPPKYDGSGQNGWWCEGRLSWIQRAPNT